MKKFWPLVILVSFGLVAWWLWDQLIRGNK